MKELNNYFVFYNSYQYVNGNKYNLIYDLDNSEIHILDCPIEHNNGIFLINELNKNILNTCKERNFGRFFSKKNTVNIINENSNIFLLPFEIITLYLQFSDFSTFEQIIILLPNVANLIILFDQKIDESIISKTLESVEISNKIINCEIFLNAKNIIKEDIIDQCIYFKISKIVIYNSKFSDIKLYRINHSKIIYVIYSKKGLNSIYEINDLISPEYFAINRPSFFIAKHFNLFHYKKFFVDSHSNLFVGNFYYKKICNLLKSKMDFKTIPNLIPLELSISKDFVEECCDSPFRYCCNDPRIPFFDKNTNNYKYKSGCLCQKQN